MSAKEATKEVAAPATRKTAGKGGGAKAGGATFSPRMEPRPLEAYSSMRNEVFFGALMAHIRAPALCVAFTILAVSPVYNYSVRLWKEQALAYPAVRAWEDEHGRLFFTVATLITKLATAVVCHGFFFAIEYMGWFDQYRMDRRKVHLPSWGLIARNVRDVLFNIFVTFPPTLYFLLYPMCRHMGMPAYDAPLPVWGEQWKVFLACYVFNDWGFYWSHRALHASSIYKHIHKQHHMYAGTVSYAAEYAHPVEVVLSNVVPTLAGVVALGAHPAVFMSWVIVRLEQTYEGHSGFCFRGSWLHRIGLTNSDTASWHDFHHTGNCGNFGAPYLDWCFGTMDAYAAMGGHEGYTKQHEDRRWSYLHRTASAAAATKSD